MLEALLAREIRLALIEGPEQRKDLHIVEQQANDVFARLERENYLKELTPETFSERLAYYSGELDSAHVFSDGNSRALRLFTSSLAKAAGHDLEWSRVLTGEADRQRQFHARDLAVMRGDITQLTQAIESSDGMVAVYDRGSLPRGLTPRAGIQLGPRVGFAYDVRGPEFHPARSRLSCSEPGPDQTRFATSVVVLPPDRWLWLYLPTVEWHNLQL
jgi:hypothetical protein